MEDTETSMISFWSGSGTESLNARKSLTRQNIQNMTQGNMEELTKRLQSALDSLEVYKMVADKLMKENTELKIRLNLTEDILEVDKGVPQDFTD